MVWDLKSSQPRAWDSVPATETALEGNFQHNGARVRTGFEVWADMLIDHTPEKMSEVTTVPAETMRRIAREFLDAAQIGAHVQEVGGEAVPQRVRMDVAAGAGERSEQPLTSGAAWRAWSEWRRADPRAIRAWDSAREDPFERRSSSFARSPRDRG